MKLGEARKIFLNFFVSAVAVFLCGSVEAGTWEHVKDKHFIVYYNFKEDLTPANLVLRKAEEYYNKIANQIGYSRYSNFWTWDDRVKIIIFPDQAAFMQNTGQPAWSQGYSSRDSKLFHSRIIVTYRQEQGFIDGVLPHEIGHLILHDFVGFDTPVPLWFDEGVAQLQEQGKRKLVDQSLKPIVKKGQHIPFSLLTRWDVRGEGDQKKVMIFYLQSLSVVDFMIRQYGSSSFGYLCRGLKDGKTMEEALRSVYSSSISTAENLEKRWAEYMRR